MEAKVYSISEIQKLLGISRTKAYDYIKEVYENDTFPSNKGGLQLPNTEIKF